MARRWAWVLLLAGCGHVGDKECGDLAAAVCAKVTSCANSYGINKSYGDTGTCLARVKLGCMNGFSAKSTGVTASNTEACAAAYPGESCDDFFNNNSPAACVHTGAIADGSGCAFGGQCQSSYCNGNRHALCGTCGAAPQDGSDCADSFCARGQICVALTMKCATPGGAGASCDRASPCDQAFTCVGVPGMPGACTMAATTAGATCDPRAHTAAGCARNLGLWCNTKTNACAAITLAGDGQACGEGADGNLTDCAGGGVCYGASYGALPVLGKCKAPAPDGGACDTVTGPPCLAPAKCVTAAGATAGTCQIATGASC